jgi:hypothetical protein
LLLLVLSALLSAPIASGITSEDVERRARGDEYEVETMLKSLHKMSAKPGSIAAVRAHAQLSDLFGGGTEGARKADRLMLSSRGQKKWDEGSSLFNGLLATARLEQAERSVIRIGALREAATAPASSGGHVTAAKGHAEDEAELENILAKMLDGLTGYEIHSAEVGETRVQ